jgi:hypothetical protein
MITLRAEPGGVTNRRFSAKTVLNYQVIVCQTLEKYHGSLVR